MQHPQKRRILAVVDVIVGLTCLFTSMHVIEMGDTQIHDVCTLLSVAHGVIGVVIGWSAVALGTVVLASGNAIEQAFVKRSAS